MAKNRFTINTVLYTVRALGVSISWSSEWREFKITNRKGETAHVGVGHYDIQSDLMEALEMGVLFAEDQRNRAIELAKKLSEAAVVNEFESGFHEKVRIAQEAFGPRPSTDDFARVDAIFNQTVRDFYGMSREDASVVHEDYPGQYITGPETLPEDEETCDAYDGTLDMAEAREVRPQDFQN